MLGFFRMTEIGIKPDNEAKTTKFHNDFVKGALEEMFDEVPDGDMKNFITILESFSE